VLRRDEEIVLQEKAGEKEPMPLIIGELLDEVFDLVSAAPILALAISQLFCLGAKFAPQVALRLIHVPVGIRLMHGERLERLAGAASAILRACVIAFSNWRRRFVGRVLIESRGRL